MTFQVAIIGRPNVGKSTLFNRLTGRKRALVHDMPGVTRDWREGEVELGRHPIKVFDTAGLDDAADGSLEARMQKQTQAAITQAHLILFVYDARAGLTPLDEHFAAMARRLGKPVQVLANKCEGRAGEGGMMEAYALGLGEPMGVSAEHGEGLGELYAFLAQAAEDHALQAGEMEEGEQEQPLRLAIMGRPNAGKSTLLNTLIGHERALTGPEAGITRDAIAVDWEWQGRAIRLFDTAGLRRKSKIDDPLERLSVSDALEAVRFSEVVVLLLDASAPWDKQDRQLADLAAAEGRAMVIGLNKCDLVKDRAAVVHALEEAIDAALPQIRGIPIIPMTGRTGAGSDKLMTAVLEAYERWNQRIPTARLNRFLAEAVDLNPPPAPGGRRIKLRYMTQVKSRPPTFVSFVSRPEDLPDSYQRYLINGIREAFDLPGVPVRLHFRKGKNPYA
jgi:GTP-binding protein